VTLEHLEKRYGKRNVDSRLQVQLEKYGGDKWSVAWNDKA